MQSIPHFLLRTPSPVLDRVTAALAEPNWREPLRWPRGGRGTAAATLDDSVAAGTADGVAQPVAQPVAKAAADRPLPGASGRPPLIGLAAVPSSRGCSNPERVAGLAGLAALTHGAPGVRIGLIDGWVDSEHDLLRTARLFQDERDAEGECGNEPPSARATFLASLLVGGQDIGLCPASTVLCLPVADGAFQDGRLPPQAAAQRVARAIRRGLDWGAHVLVLGAGSATDHPAVTTACERALQAGVRIIAPAAPCTPPAHPAWVGVVPAGRSAVARPGLVSVPVVELLGAALPAGSVPMRDVCCALASLTAGFAQLSALRRDLSAEAIWSALLQPYDDTRTAAYDLSAALLGLALR